MSEERIVCGMVSIVAGALQAVIDIQRSIVEWQNTTLFITYYEKDPILVISVLNIVV